MHAFTRPGFSGPGLPVDLRLRFRVSPGQSRSARCDAAPASAASTPVRVAAAELRNAQSFTTITDRAERSRALFTEAGKVIQSRAA